MKWVILERQRDEPLGGGRGWHPIETFQDETIAQKRLKELDEEDRAENWRIHCLVSR